MSDQSIPQIGISYYWCIQILLLGALWSRASALEWVLLICIISELGPIPSTTLLHTHKHLRRRKKGVVVLLIITLLKLEMGSLGVTFVNSV